MTRFSVRNIRAGDVLSLDRARTVAVETMTLVTAVAAVNKKSLEESESADLNSTYVRRHVQLPCCELIAPCSSSLLLLMNVEMVI